MKHTSIFPGRYVQAKGALGCMAEELIRLGKNVLVVAGGTAEKTVIPRHVRQWRQSLELAVESFGGECTSDEIERLAELVRRRGCDVVVGMGGGKVIDTAKAVGHSARCHAVVAPTIASTDAPTSAVAVLYTNEGAFSRYLFLPKNPELVLVDTQVIAQAPARFLVAGMGDAVATWFEADACRQSNSPNQCGGIGTLAAHNLARLCYDTVLQYGLAALAACEQKVVTPALSHVIEANTLLSGIGFESGGLASAHSIHNGLTKLPATHSYYHGEKVALGVLAGLFLANRPPELIDEVYWFCRSVGLPTKLADVGLGEVTDDELRVVAEAACIDSETIHHEPCPAGPDEVFAALKTADQYGKKQI